MHWLVFPCLSETLNNAANLLYPVCLIRYNRGNNFHSILQHKEQFWNWLKHLIADSQENVFQLYIALFSFDIWNMMFQQQFKTLYRQTKIISFIRFFFF